MDRKTLIARFRQLLSVDRNAFAIYSQLSESAEDARLRSIFSDIAQDEKRHCNLNEEMLSLLER